ncbi:type III pantothenate kinase [Pelobium sp.]|nr:type III pantothenate kinase [Pelobium sp.]MDA9554691.1 type III pantothenate kinase [Pelobium sp.]
MTNLVVDIGNSFVKIAVFNQDKKVFSDQLSTLKLELLLQLKSAYNVQHLIISSVREGIIVDEEEVKQHFGYIRFNQSTPTPLQNKYQSPQTLGLDRLAAVVGAQKLFPAQNVFVIDAGTCITYDAVNEKGEYFGGSISPGIKMRFEAMHQFTSKLPLVNFDKDFNKTYGANSKEAISSGAINGVLFEVEGFIQQQLKTNPKTKIILCGGDSAFFDSRFKNSIFAHLISHEPDLVLIGLNTVINYQHDHN